MPYLSSINFNTNKLHPYPYDIPAIKFAKNINLSKPITFFIGENGTGKSTLLESVAFRLHLPHLDGSDYAKSSFNAAKTLLPYLELKWSIERSVGFFFRAEDFGDYLNSVNRNDASLHADLDELHDEVPKDIVKQIKDSANYQLHHMRKNYGQELESFSHGEAYLHIMNQVINQRGIYLLDEPEAALSPAKQLSLIYFLNQHLHHYMSQFIIATHSPMLMAYPGATIYEITDNGMEQTALEDTNHYAVTKSFLNNPEAYFRHFD